MSEETAINKIYTVDEMQAHARRCQKQGRLIGFVPTMGYLHEGHLALVRTGIEKCDELVVSIFVNPTQFGPSEDFDAYPSDIERDCALLKKEGVQTVFLPSKETLYPEGYQTYVSLETLPNHLCGLSRPIHFRGVATIVTKLFNIVNPQVALFGEKDFQQLAVIRCLVRELNFDIEIIGVPTVREDDGLAMSSRNTYLTDHQRASAVCLYNALEQAKKKVRQGERDAAVLIRETTAFISAFPDTEIDYVSICDPDTLNDQSEIKKPVLMALAVKVGKPRLIDNAILVP